MKTRDIKMLAVGFAAGALSTGAIIGAGVAHAGPGDAYFLECLNAKGVVVRNVADVLDIGMRIQNDQKQGTPVATTLYNLEHYFGVPPEIAADDVACALDTLMS
jgi:hypothetical protein